MNFMIPFAYFFGQETTIKWKKIFYYGAMGIFIVGNLVSFSRGGFLGLVTVMGYCWFKSPRKITGIVIVGIMIFVMVLFAPPGYWDEMDTIKQGTEDSTGEARINYWKAAINMFKDYPIIGVGPNNFGIWYPDYDITGKGQREWGRVAHSLYFTLIPEWGIVGVIIFLLIIKVSEKDKRFLHRLEREKQDIMEKAAISPNEKDILSDTIRKGHYISMALTGGLIAYLVTGVFIAVLYYSYFWTLTIYTVLLKNSITDSLKRAGVDSRRLE